MSFGAGESLIGGFLCELQTDTVANLGISDYGIYTFYDQDCFTPLQNCQVDYPDPDPTTTTTDSTTTTTDSTTTTTDPTTTTTSSATPTPTTICGSPGYDLGVASYYYDATLGTQDLCSAKCQCDSACLSYAVGGGACLLYTVTAASNLNPVSTSSNLFYERDCPLSDGSTPSCIVTTTTTASATPTPTPTGPQCGIVGFDNGISPSYFYDGNAADANFASCAAVCATNSCVSFAFGGGACLLYSESVSSIITPSAGSAYTFFDASCSDPGDGTTTTTSATPTPTTVVKMVRRAMATMRS